MDDTGRRTVLIIEDNDINREMLSLILENDYNVLQAENGREGLDILSRSIISQSTDWIRGCPAVQRRSCADPSGKGNDEARTLYTDF